MHLLVGKVMEIVVTSEMKELEEPSNSLSSIGQIGDIGREYFEANQLSTKQYIEPESISARNFKEELEIKEEVKDT